MNKPDSLRQRLVAQVPGLAQHPDRLMIFIDNGTIRSTAARGLSFEYAYTLNIILTDYAGHPDAVAIPLLAWLGQHQRELLENHDLVQQAITFEADLLDNSKVDLAIKLPLTERVIVKAADDGSLQVTHPPEPVPENAYMPPQGVMLRGSTGEEIGRWSSP
ncbi:phage tail protein [Pseudomonas japonica]|uniref:phage tail protein n=1 Tax=Pseudomonas japonica TaxID=256466 RepID=UPI0015E41AEE|nr:phage tail protein [Pseudomonas japonica]MBA1289181.1 phage tail protein [Pseudomonas japonica]